MTLRLKTLAEQVMVITGASSGIGLVTAKAAAARGACVVLAARNEKDLRHATDAIRRAGGRAAYAVSDVADPAQVDAIAGTAIREFGRIDTWVNNAAVAMYGRATEVSIEDLRRQMDVNYWGQVYGSRTAVAHLRQNGGALINVGSALSDRAIPLQGGYCASKHALKAFTDTLRMELEEEGIPISVTLIKPASVDTPFFEKARTYLGVEPQPVPPVYAPEVVSDVILHAAQHPLRELIAGGSGAKLSGARFAPRLADLYMERWTFDAQRTDQLTHGRSDNLYAPVPDDGGERGRNWNGHTRESSVYTRTALHPGAAVLLIAGLAIGLGTIVGRGASRHRRRGATLRHEEIMENTNTLMRVADNPAIDQVAQPLSKAVRGAYEAAGPIGQRAKNALHGVWLGHPLHPVFTDIPIGAWTTALALDTASNGDPGMRRAATFAIGVGLTGALGAAATGLTDWSETDGRSRRAGLIHGLLNITATTLFAAAFALRQRDSHDGGRKCAWTAYAIALGAAYLGGDLVYGQRIGVTHADREFPEEFTAVLPSAALEENSMVRARAGNADVLLVRQHGRVCALAHACAHLGGPLSEGTLKDGSVVCPWHGSEFALDDGRVLNGPATHDQPCLVARERDGQIEVKAVA